MILKKKQLEMILSQVKPNPEPKLKWEGYNLDTESAARMACIAAWIHDDLFGKNVLDLGCGSGILAIAASILGAQWVVGVDIDKEAVIVAYKNSRSVGALVDFIISDIKCVVGDFDTVLMNPPFGSWKRGADIQFLKKALEISNVVYSLHKHSQSVRELLKRKVVHMCGKIDKIYELEITISSTYSFHRKKRYAVKVDLYRTIKNNSSEMSETSVIVKQQN